MGPTALGKTAVAVELAERLGAEIVSADSMQVYRGLPILTNQPTPGESRRVRHHLVGVVDPWREYSVAEFAEAARTAIQALLAAGTPVIVEGGSGLYVRAALGGLSFAPASPQVRELLERRLAEEGLAALVADIEQRDPGTAQTIDLHNPRRVVRALEAIVTRGAPLPPEERRQLWSQANSYDHRLIVLEEERDVLRRHIDERVEQMVAAGALEEVRRLYQGPAPSRTVAQAIGVKELAAHLRDELPLEDAISQTQARTRRLVRRQETWMKKVVAGRMPVAGRSPAVIAELILSELAG